MQQGALSQATAFVRGVDDIYDREGEMNPAGWLLTGVCGDKHNIRMISRVRKWCYSLYYCDSSTANIASPIAL